MKNIKSRGLFLETFSLAMIAFILMALGGLFPRIDPLNLAYWADRWAIGTLGIRQAIACYGVAAAVAALASFCLIRYRSTTLSAQFIRWFRSVAGEVRVTWIWLCQTIEVKGSDTVLWLALVSAIGAMVRCYFLARTMQYDEAHTFLRFINRGVNDLFYYYANNHILHTLLARASVEIFGRHPAAIRFPAFVAGVLVIPLTFFLSRLLTRRRESGFFASGFAAVFPFLILFDTSARGYSILNVLTLVLAILAFRLIEQPSTTLCSLIALVIALGLLDIPTFLFPAAGLFSWALVMLVQQGRGTRWILARVVMPCAAVTTGLTGLFYTPAIIASDGIKRVVGNALTTGTTWSVFFVDLPFHVVETLHKFLRDIPKIPVYAAVFLLITGLCSLALKRRWIAFTLFPSLLTVGAAVLVARHRVPFPRTWIYVLPFAFALVDAGIILFIRSFTVRARCVVLLCAGGFAVHLMNQNAISSYSDIGIFPQAPVLAKALASAGMKPQDKLVAPVPADDIMNFYTWHQNLPHDKGQPDDISATREFVVLMKMKEYNFPDYSLRALTRRETQKILDTGDAEIHVAYLKEMKRGANFPPRKNQSLHNATH